MDGQRTRLCLGTEREEKQEPQGVPRSQGALEPAAAKGLPEQPCRVQHSSTELSSTCLEQREQLVPRCSLAERAAWMLQQGQAREDGQAAIPPLTPCSGPFPAQTKQLLTVLGRAQQQRPESLPSLFTREGPTMTLCAGGRCLLRVWRR